MKDKFKGRWYQFSLRTFFVLVTLVCIGFGYWVHWSKEWISQRHEWRDANPQAPHIFFDGAKPMPRAPFGLWLFGEKAEWIIYVRSEKEEREGKRLFPEAKIGRPFLPYEKQPGQTDQ